MMQCKAKSENLAHILGYQIWAVTNLPPLQESRPEIPRVGRRMRETWQPPDAWLDGISGNLTFVWLWEPSKGASGGLLMGVREDKYEVGSCVTGRFFTRMTIMDKITRFKWDLVNIYGAANAKDKSDFLVDLVHILNLNQLPILIGGDFNIIRRMYDRNKVRKLSKWTSIFNSIIEHWV